MNTCDRFLGCMIGAAVGDALGTAGEMQKPGSFDEIKNMVGGGPFHLLPGQWTDDSSMMMCLAESLLRCEKVNLNDSLSSYLAWYDQGHNGSSGKCFDIGMATRTALERFRSKHIDNGEYGSTEEGASGNGGIMRMASIPMRYAMEKDQWEAKTAKASEYQSLATHGSIIAKDSARFWGVLVAWALQGATKHQLLRECIQMGIWKSNPLEARVERVAQGSWDEKEFGSEPEDIRNSGFVIKTMEAALHYFGRSMSFRAGALLAANGGGDADTVACVYGMLAGAHYGLSGIPKEWVDCCAFLPLLEGTAMELFRRYGDGTTVCDLVRWPESSYEEMHALHLQLEQRYHMIRRRLDPCPKQYKTVDAFEQDLKELYALLPDTLMGQAFREEYERMAHSCRGLLRDRIQDSERKRGMMLGFKLPK